MNNRKMSPIDQNRASVLFKEGIKRLNKDFSLDAIAFFDGMVFQYGESVITEEFRQARKKALISAGRNLNYPLPQSIVESDYSKLEHKCNLCGGTTVLYEKIHNKDWALCTSCHFLQYLLNSSSISGLGKGEPDGAKQPADSLVHSRELFFCELFLKNMNWQSVLMYGVGWSLALERLLRAGYDVVGCDLWRPLIEERKASLGCERFHHRDELPKTKWHVISAFEVFEHFINPIHDVGIMVDRLEEEGVIIGCTDFWHGNHLGEHPSADLSYWKHGTHVTAWTFSSFKWMADYFDLNVSFFKVDKPGSGAKVFFALHRGKKTKRFICSIPAVIAVSF